MKRLSYLSLKKALHWSRQVPRAVAADGAVDLVRAVEAVDEEVADGRFRKTAAAVAGQRLAALVGARRDPRRLARHHPENVKILDGCERLETGSTKKSNFEASVNT